MGFFANLLSSSNPLWIGNNASPPVTVTVPSGLAVGDLMYLFGATSSSPGNGFTTPTNWTPVLSKNGTNSFGGAAALFSKVAVSTDIGSTFTFTGSALGSAVSYQLLCVRSDVTAGGSLSPTVTAFEQTSATTTITMPHIPVVHASDMRIVFHVNGGTATLTGPTENNPFPVKYWQQYGSAEGAGGRQTQTLGCTVASATDSGTTSWAVSASTKLYCMMIDVSDGTAVQPTIGKNDDENLALAPIYAMADEHLTTLQIDSSAGRGQGGGVSVF